MRYIFEDKKEDLISRFYRSAFREDFSENYFIYAGGAGNLEDKMMDTIQKYKKEDILIFMDMPPGNREVRKIYIQLKALIKKEGYPVLIIPIVCAEYYLINSLVELGVVPKNTNIKICTEIDLFKKSTLYENENERKRFNNFERYCKFILIKGV